ncbi:cytochrome P450 [Diaporthe sp. PMI_573]|nr:cytochrome P450 [Diaporthaceae sp. PMI_573]
MLLALACLLLASRYTSWLRRSRCSQGSRPQGDLASGADGTKLYYGGKPWPQYVARFNLKLSYVYGPVVLINHPSTTLLARLRRWLLQWVYRTRDSAETTLLINSFSENERPLKSLLGACASRRPSIPAGKYLSRGRRIVLQPYGSDWTRHRRAFTSLLTKEKISHKWTRALRHEAMVMVCRIAELETSQGSAGTTILDEISRFTASSVLQVTYARRAETPDDPILRDLRTVSQNIASAFTPGKYWVEDFPLLDFFPASISPWKRKLTSDHRFEMALFKGLLHGVEIRLDGSQTAQCAAAELLRNREQLRLDQDDIAYLAAGIFEAGTETTAMTINTFLLAAACYPEMTRRAQAEIDEYMCRKESDEESVPTFTDLQQLPYLGAMVKESLRLTPTGSSGVGHTPTKLDSHDLYLEDDGLEDKTKITIPHGATVLANTYGLHHDHNRYSDPWRFDPGRWMAPGSDQESPPPGVQKCSVSGSYSLDHTHANFAFGFGRRICPGSSLASHSLSMAISLLLLCFNFKLTDRAETHCHSVEKQDREESRRFAELFRTDRGRAAVDWERRSKEECLDRRDRLGRVLIDAYIAFMLSRKQLDECIRLEPRKERPWLRAVGDSLAFMWEQ